MWQLAFRKCYYDHQRKMGGLYDATKHILKESLLTAVTKLMSSLVPKSPLALKAAENNNNNFLMYFVFPSLPWTLALMNNAFPSDHIHKESSLGRRKKNSISRNNTYCQQIASGMKTARIWRVQKLQGWQNRWKRECWKEKRVFNVSPVRIFRL